MIINSLFRPDEAVSTPMGDRPVRSIVKALTWRVLGTLDTMVVSWIITGSVRAAFTIGAIELVTKMTLYLGHERIWNRIQWGKQT
ncbi:MAG: DUF2061 domain-containing protein [Bacteroidia bacterium]|nr:DUF2061 domain-containing protein [Bacteroidia bacterium]